MLREVIWTLSRLPWWLGHLLLAAGLFGLPLALRARP